MFLINCDNRECMKSTQAVLSLEDNLVYCADCEKSINNITIFTKNQLKNMKQIKRAKKDTFSSKCHSCSNEALPKLVQDKLCCIKCGVHLINIPKPF